MLSCHTSTNIFVLEVKNDVPSKRLKLGTQQPNSNAKHVREQANPKPPAPQAPRAAASANVEPAGVIIKPPVAQNVPVASSRLSRKPEMGKAEKVLDQKLVKAYYWKVSSQDARQMLADHIAAKTKNRNHPDRMSTFSRLFRNKGFGEPMYNAFGGIPIRQQKRWLNEIGNEPCSNLKSERVLTDEATVFGADGRVTAPFGTKVDVPLFLDPHSSQKGQVETEWVTGRFLRKSANGAEYIRQTAVTTIPYSNKWATPPTLQKFIETTNWGGVKFLSGYSIYPEKFPTNQTIQGTLNIVSVSQNLW